MLPNLSAVLQTFEQTVKLKTIIQTVSNHRPQESESTTLIKAVVQPEQPENLNIDNLNYSLRYINVHSTAAMSVRDKIEYKDTDYRIIRVSRFDDYGYYRSIAEEVK